MSLSGPRARSSQIRVDLQIVADMIEPGTRVLDVGCGEGDLLAYLTEFRRVDARGIELSQAGVNVCVGHGLSVIQGDADTDLKDYPSDAFDYVVLSQTLQATWDPKGVLEDLVRIGRRAIVSFPNFGHWRVRLALLAGGRMPVTPLLTDSWYDTPNIHLCTITDFLALCGAMGVTIERGLILGEDGRPWRRPASSRLANLLGAQGVFMLRQG